VGAQHLELQGDAVGKNTSSEPKKLTVSLDVIPLPADRSRSACPTFRAAQESLALEGDALQRVESFAREEGVTCYSVLLSAFQILLHRYSGSESNSTALRPDFTADPTFRELLALLTHKVSDTPVAAVDLSLELIPRPGAVDCVLTYNGALFESETIHRMLGHYQVLLDAAIENPDRCISELPILTEGERRQILIEWNDTKREIPRVCAHQLFEEQVEQTPDAFALVYENRHLTYSELNERANQLAHKLQSLGVGPDAMVGICLERSLEMVVGILAILKAGGAYVPLDPTYPKQRLAVMLEDLHPPVVLCHKHWMEGLTQEASTVLPVESWPELTAGQSSDNPHSAVTLDNLAYVLYTSGSTGKPKGVLIPQRALTNYLVWCISAYQANEGRGAPVHTPIGFDLTITSLFPPLLCGGCAVLIPEDPSLEALTAELRSGNFSLVKLTPAHLEALSHKLSGDEPGILTRTFVIGGEALTGQALNFWRKQSPTVRLINEYGPTEATVGCCVYEVPSGPVPAGAIPIGRPIANVRLYVLDRNLQPVPVGIPGELHIGGDGLARGYHRRPELTAEKFIPDPFSGDPEARLYKTGDLVRYRPDGILEFLGRIDDQVKIRGFRIELSEIEVTLTEHPGVREAVVIAYENAGADRRLAAYVVPDRKTAASEQELRTFLKQRLPDYMLPVTYTFLEALPLTSNAKVDRKALPPPSLASEDRTRKLDAPRDELERQLLKIWEDVLPPRPIGVRDDFFDLGGNSLLAIKMLARVEKTLARKAPVGAMFRAPTIEQLATLLRNPVPLERPGVFEIQSKGWRPPFFCMGAGPMFRILANALGRDQPFLGVPLPEASDLPTPYRLQDIAGYCVRSMRERQPEGPYFLGGWSDAGVLAYEMAQQLQQQGHRVGLLVLFDAENPAHLRSLRAVEKTVARFYFLAQWLESQGKKLWQSEMGEVSKHIRRGFAFRLAVARGWMWSIAYQIHLSTDLRVESGIQSVEHVSAFVTKKYQPKPYTGRVALFSRSDRPAGRYRDPKFGWGEIAGGLEVHEVPGNHMDMFLEPNVQTLATKLRACLCEAREADLAMSAGVAKP
jgi:amino acid adenylation domain-containing protein